MDNVMTLRNAARVVAGALALVVLVFACIFAIGSFEPGVSAWTNLARWFAAAALFVVFVALSIFALKEPPPRLPRERRWDEAIMYSDRL